MKRIKISFAAAALAATITVAPANAATVFEEDFSDNSAGWTLGPEWEIGPAVDGCGDPGTDHSPSADNGIAGVVIGGCTSTAIHDTYFLTSPVVDLSSLGDATLSFWRDLLSDYSPYMKNVVQLGNNGTWTTVWETLGSPGINDATWTEMTFDLSDHLVSTFQFRIGVSVGSSGAFSRGSWNVDDVSIMSSTSPVPIGPAGPLALTGLGALLAVRSRRRKSRGR